MPRVKLFNTLFHSRKMNAKQCWIPKKQSFLIFPCLNNIVSNDFSFLPFFMMLKCIENWGSRYPPKRVPWAGCKNIFKFTLYIYIFWETKQKKFIIEPKSYTVMLLYLFYDSCLFAQIKKNHIYHICQEHWFCIIIVPKSYQHIGKKQFPINDPFLF